MESDEEEDFNRRKKDIYRHFIALWPVRFVILTWRRIFIKGVESACFYATAAGIDLVVRVGRVR